MSRSLALAAAMLIAVPILAQDAAPTPAEKPKTKRICRVDASENPHFPRRTCRTVPVDMPAAEVAASAAVQQPVAVQVAQNASAPR